jgi:hypothetical protein
MLAAGDPGAPAAPRQFGSLDGHGSPFGPLQFGSLDRQAAPVLPAGPFWFQAIAAVPLPHFLPCLTTVSAPFFPTQPRIVPSEPVKLVAA